MPPWTGRCFSMWISTSAVMLRRSSAPATIFQAVFRSAVPVFVVGTPGWFEVNRIAVAVARLTATVTKSCRANV